MKKQSFKASASQAFSRLIWAEARIEEAILGGGIALLAALLIADSTSRQIYHSLYFTADISKFLIILVSFGGLGYAVRKARHIRMAMIFDLVNARVKKLMVLTTSLVSGIVPLYLTYYSLIYLLKVQSFGHLTPAMRLPYWTFLIIIPVGFFLAGFQYLLTFIKNVSTKEVWVTYEQKSEYED